MKKLSCEDLGRVIGGALDETQATREATDGDPGVQDAADLAGIDESGKANLLGFEGVASEPELSEP
jgi:hypothetical protein